MEIYSKGGPGPHMLRQMQGYVTPLPVVGKGVNSLQVWVWVDIAIPINFKTSSRTLKMVEN